jgi:hypothetical protein
MQIRRQLAGILEAHSHKVILMEDASDHANETVIQKFDRLLRGGVTDVVLYWPPLAKMQTTYDELILLCDRADFVKKGGLKLWALHHTTVARITQETFDVLEQGNRSRYLTAVVRLGIRPIEWNTAKELLESTELLANQL